MRPGALRDGLPPAITSTSDFTANGVTALAEAACGLPLQLGYRGASPPRADTMLVLRPKQTIHQFVRGRALTRLSTDTGRPVAKDRHLIRGLRVKW
jgi:hypothetical protein